MKKALFPILIFLFPAFCAFAETPEQRFQAANEAFSKNDFERAAQLYESIAKSGNRSAELEYNLGNTYFRLGELGLAILHFERAALLQPADADIRHNLQIARSQIKEDVATLPEFFLAKGWKTLRRLASSGGWGGAALTLWWVGFAGFAVWLLGKSRQQKKRGFLVGAVCLALSLLPFSLAMSSLSFEKNSRQAILLEETAPLRNAPDEASAEVLLLHEGMKMELLDELGGWQKVQLNNGEVGWLPAKTVEQI